jgi:hypothetical protein
MKDWKLTYKVTCDYLCFRHWLVTAESVNEARMEISTRLNVPLEQVDASPAALTAPTNQFIRSPLNTKLNAELPTKTAH